MIVDRFVPSPFHSSRQGHVPLAIVVHIMEGTLDGTGAWFQDPRARVSTHYGVGKAGEVHQYVDVTRAAWGNGSVSSDAPWKMLHDLPGISPNLWTLSIEHEGFADEPWADEMYDASARLVRTLADVFRIPLDRDHVVGHREIRTDKSCPGWVYDRLPELLERARSA